MANRFPSHRPRWFPTMTRTAPTLSPTCPRLPACTRYPPVDPSLSSPLHSHPCIWLNGPLSQLTPCPTPMHRPHLPPPHLALPCPSTPLPELLSSRSSPLAFDLQVTVLFAGQNIERSPFEVNVGMALGDANKVSARGPGLEPVGNVANKPTYFDIYTAGGDGPFHQTPHDYSRWGNLGARGRAWPEGHGLRVREP